MEEIWKPVKGYDGVYEVSSFGRLRSVDRYQTNVNGVRRLLRGRLISPGFADGYPVAVLMKDGKRRSVKIHRLVADAFMPNPEDKPFIDHIDTNRANCVVENLRWVSSKENANNPLSKNNYARAASKEFGSGWETINTRNKNKSVHAEIPVSQYSLDGTLKNKYRSIADAARNTGIQRASIIHAISGRIKQAGGFLWVKDGATPKKYIPNTPARQKKVYQYSADGSFIKEWTSVSEAERTLLIRNVSRCARHNKFLAGGCKWSYEKKESL